MGADKDVLGVIFSAANIRQVMSLLVLTVYDESYDLAEVSADAVAGVTQVIPGVIGRRLMQRQTVIVQLMETTFSVAVYHWYVVTSLPLLTAVCIQHIIQ